MFKFEIIENGSEKWKEIINQAAVYDFHHTSYFHKIDTAFTSKLLFFSDGDHFIALPIVIRPIQDTAFFDVTSVYGYAGPVHKFGESYDPVELLLFFKTNFVAFCKEHNIVSVFSRLHPLIDQKTILEGLGEIVDLNKTVSIDLKKSAEEQRKEYRKSLKSELNQLGRKEIYVKEADSQEETDQFISIYYETMDRVHAASNYYFSKEYFYEFLNNPDFKSKLLIAVKNEKVIAGAIFTLTEKIMQYHLAGTTEEFIPETPMKLILNEARLLGNETTAEDLHLGGGVGGQDDDSLFRFKSAFSKNFKQFSVWKFIVDQEIYDELSKDKTHPSFFPLYRS
ncbi:peptidogalycan biosysnthesis protein [Chryseobacterium sp. SSA4.19]|uniref:peptidogalycan biosysnthesis protein n=1 Tax=Chryseobacterium sp. SSA4.19 TaxID=2919915 RepID=UPI001F4EF78F|nr:peptidogalycan biosysnthesis protein [Chryseobacterium sp. SSA4.19]MCJ8152373.1 peptidogalycan biosysnthesis protein [Chryseobacterium sp. SSA4.19]